MTEQELRKSLNEHLAPADLPDSRKQAILAQLRAEAAPAPEKGDPTMFRPHKFRTALLVAVIVTLLSFTVAVATGYTGFVNFKGNPVEDPMMAMPTPIPTNAPRPGDITEAVFNAIASQEMNTHPEYMIDVVYSSPEIITNKYTERSASHDQLITVTSLEEAAALVGNVLELPRIPEGFAFHYGYVTLSCAADSAYELVSERTTPEGVIIRHYDIPESKAVPTCVHLTLKNDAGDLIDCIVDLAMNWSTFFDVNEEDAVQTPDMPGMTDAIVISGDDRTRLDMRRKLDEPIGVLYSWASCEPEFYPHFYEMVEYRAESETVPAEVLLSMFGE